jgi:pSer/pThr/pTyr-binding forkhead associated (FHA) protein
MPVSSPKAAPAPAPPLPAPSAAPRKPAAAPITQALTIHYQGRPFQVTKDRFIIGRGKTTSDLTIRDPNVSRQHALVEFSGGNFYMVDMGSTNGIEFSGQRVQRKAIQNGDVFRICDHELFCSMS